MSRRAGTLCLLSLLLSSGSLLADVFWKVAADAPLAPQISTILGDDRRTLAFGYDRAWEFDGANWVKARLELDGTETVPGTPAFAGGRFFAVDRPGSGLRLYVLDGSNWRVFSEIRVPINSFLFGVDRLFATVGPFNVCAESGGCGPDPSKWGSLISISLSDGTVRTEPPLPACSGQFFVIKGKLHLLATPVACGGPSANAKRIAPRSDAATNFYRLDPAGWTTLPPATVPLFSLTCTPSTLWTFYGVSGNQLVAQLFDGDHWTEMLYLPRTVLGPGVPIEWNGRLLYVSDMNRDSLYQLSSNGLVPFVPNSPYRRPAKLFTAGSRLFAWSIGNPVDVLSDGGWKETAGIDGTPGAATFLSDGKTTFALMGGNVFKKEIEWQRLPTPGGSEATGGFTYQGRIGVTDYSSWPVLRLLLYSDETGRWDDLRFPLTTINDYYQPMILQVGDDLYVTKRIDEVFRLRHGGWLGIQGPHENDYPALRHLRIAGGNLVMVGEATTRRVDEARLVNAFPDLPEGWAVKDVAEVQGSVFLSVAIPPGVPLDRGTPLVVERAAGSWQPVVRIGDLGTTWLNSDWLQLETIAGRLFARWNDGVSPVEISGGKLSAVRGESEIGTLSSRGEFATSHDNLGTWAIGKILAPVERVRKTIPAIVDAVGLGGRYRSTLFLGNFSADRTTTVRLHAGPDSLPLREVLLPPGAQTRIEDLAPGFVGPLTLDFDGLVDDGDAWAAVRVWNEADGGTAGVALEGRDAGTFSLGQTRLVMPNPRPGTRSHLAAAAGTDGLRQPIFATAFNPAGSYPPHGIGFTLPSGGFQQSDPDAIFNDWPVVFGAFGATDDLLCYSVRNDDRTQDGVVVQAGPRWLHPGTGTIFIPAAVAVSTAKGTFRTELAIATADLSADTQASLRFRGRSAGPDINVAVPVGIPVASVLRIEDLGGWLASNGVPVVPDDFDGTITIEPKKGASAAGLLGYVAVLGRGPSAQGDFSTSVPMFEEVEWASDAAVVPGLLENAAFRSNLAVANPERSGGPPDSLSVTLSVTVRNDTGQVVGSVPSMTLQPGERRQLNQILRLAGTASSGWAEIRRISGSGRFVAYGVVNDNPTGDGTVFRMVRSR